MAENPVMRMTKANGTPYKTWRLEVDDYMDLTGVSEERLRELYDADKHPYAAGEILLGDDCETVANAALPLFSEDPVTEEALRAMGFTQSPNPRYVALKGKDHAVCIRKSGELGSVSGEVFDKTSKEMIVFEPVDMGHLRCLLRGLGITPNEPGG